MLPLTPVARPYNKLIRFLLNHCWIDCATLRKFVYQVSNGELQAIMDEKKEWD
jgi:4-alpha-glucanotransferase